MIRENVVVTLAKYFKGLATDVEQGLFEFSNNFCNSAVEFRNLEEEVYVDKFNDIVYNCSQPSILDHILKNYGPKEIAYLKPFELDPSKWSKIIERKTNSIQALLDLPTITSKPCKVCKCTQFFYRQLQTRSADEPMTIFHICRDCGQTIKY